MITKKEFIDQRLELVIERIKVNACLEDDEVKRMLLDVYMKALEDIRSVLSTCDNDDLK